jgi:co-chaperonin GroES (HSP10)
MNIAKPLRDLMVVERFEKTELSEGGIFLPGNTLESNTVQGIIRSIGGGTTNEKTGDVVEIDVKIGDVVLFHANAGIKVSSPREVPERFLIREEDVLAIVI